MRLLLTLQGLAIGFAVSALAQWKDTADPRVAQQLVSFYDSALRTKYDEAFNNGDAGAMAGDEACILAAPQRHADSGLAHVRNVSAFLAWRFSSHQSLACSFQ